MPDAMPGLALNDHVVIDVDGGPDGFDRFVKYADKIGARIDHAPLCETPSDGAHIVFRQPDGESLGNSRGNLPPKLELPTDVRGDGGYIIAPGSFRGDDVNRLYNPVTPNGDPLAVLDGAPLPPDVFAGIIRRELDADGKPIALTPAPASDDGSARQCRKAPHGWA